MDLMKLYNGMPVAGQNLACTAKGALIKRQRYSPYFEKKLEQYKKTGAFRLERIQEYQDKWLQRLAVHAYETVPYYKKEFDECGFNPYTFRHADELRVLPIITKDVLKENIQDFISNARLKSRTYIHLTGGTTGKSLTYYTTYHEQAEQWAVWWRYRNNLGITRDDWAGEFGSKRIVPMGQRKPPYWRLDYAEKRLFFSPYHLNADTVRDYAAGLMNVKWLHGYTSKLADMAYWLVESGIRVPMSHVTIGAENLYDTQKKLMEEAFQTKVYQHYGLTEGAANISQSLDGTLRVDEDFCYVEFVENGTDCSMIGTPLHNYRMPLIRYNTGDHAVLSRKQDGGFRIVDALHGRDSEYVVTDQGTKVTGVEFDEEVFAKVDHMAEAQVVQRSTDSLEIRVIKLEGYSREDEQTLLRKLNEIVGTGMNCQITYPRSLQKEKNGKFRLILSSL